MIDYTAEKLIPFHAAAKRLAVSPKDLIELINKKLLVRPVRIGENLSFFSSDLDEFISRLHYARQKTPDKDMFR